MKNIVLTKALSSSCNAQLLKGCSLFVEDSSTHIVYFVNLEGIIVLDENFKTKTVIPCRDQFDYFDPVSIDLLQDRNEVCIILKNAQVITMDVESYAICTVGFLGETCLATAWSPDETILTVSEDDRVVFYDGSFEIINYWNLSNSDTGKESLVAVGWGSAETQFQGSAGKAVRKPVEVSRSAYPEDSHNSYIRWRADGSVVTVSFHERESDERRIAVFNRDGELMARLKNYESLEEIFSIRPSGNCIATTTRSSDGARMLVFYEKNGEKRREMLLSPMADQSKIINMQWDVEASCLCVHVQYNDKEELELWTESNYDWKRQWTASFKGALNWKWDTEKARRMCVLLNDGVYIRLYFSRLLGLVGSTALVVGTGTLHLTDFERCPVPPPLYEYALTIKGAAHSYAFDDSRLAVIDSDMTLHIARHLFYTKQQ
ncbi:hypothetical protein DICVIV_04303 [Dictyocaulus viviparus]|uniref:ELP1 first N-terminal beta-propeller domain-containing protein n=1 Tax=Dictyocaulus viviparus TaxID=29172 RepID=A0A0D8Y4R6_DICVI|nr:hypothetical protein DICVIV_04303 [Dictyocaulus viviparus]